MPQGVALMITSKGVSAICAAVMVAAPALFASSLAEESLRLQTATCEHFSTSP